MEGVFEEEPNCGCSSNMLSVVEQLQAFFDPIIRSDQKVDLRWKSSIGWTR
jgi:hypothetical protein